MRLLRAIAVLLAFAGLVAGGVHAPSMALPAPAEELSHAQLEDCHGATDQHQEVAATPGCCPDGCFGGCLLTGALPVGPVVREPLLVRLPVRGPQASSPPSLAPDPVSPPPRADA